MPYEIDYTLNGYGSTAVSQGINAEVAISVAFRLGLIPQGATIQAWREKAVSK